MDKENCSLGRFKYGRPRLDLTIYLILKCTCSGLISYFDAALYWLLRVIYQLWNAATVLIHQILFVLTVPITVLTVTSVSLRPKVIQ